MAANSFHIKTCIEISAENKQLNSDKSKTIISAINNDVDMDIQMQPQQPRHIMFPLTQFGKKQRRFRAQWFDLYSWLEWDNKIKLPFATVVKLLINLI